MPKRPLNKKQAITERWGWAKRTFIAAQIAAGSSHANAAQLWIQKRRGLTGLNINWPTAQHIESYPPGNRGDYEEADWNDGQGENLPQEARREPIWDEFLNEAELKELYEQEEAVLGASHSKYGRHDQRYRLHADSSQLPKDDDYNFFPVYKRLHKPKELTEPQAATERATVNKPQIQTAESDTESLFDKSESDSSPISRTPPGEAIPIRVPETPSISDPSSSDPSSSSTNMSSAGSSQPRMPVLDNEIEMHQVFGGDASDGLKESRGGSGGGLAGAGNNMMFKGFAGTTKCRPDKPYTYEETFKRPFAIHTEFQTTDISPAAVLHLNPQNVPDFATPTLANYEDSYMIGECDHTGVTVPYWWMEASMKDRDWNKPMDHIGYKVIEYGFNIPNLRLSVMNNERVDVTAVAPAPPADARMWMFVDTNNDYGVVQSHQSTSFQHSNYFREEDILSAEFGRYNLPQLGRRFFIFPKSEGMTIAGDRQWDLNTDTVSSADANMLYDFKRHDGYKEFTLSEASLGLSYKPNAPVIRFPHPPQTSVDYCMKQQGITVTAAAALWNNNPKPAGAHLDLHYWASTYQKFIEDFPQVGIDPTSIMNMGEVNYYMANVSDYYGEIADKNPVNSFPEIQNAVNRVGSQPVRPLVMDPSTIQNITGMAHFSKIREISRADVTDEGAHHASGLSKRPPIFTFGVHKELEDQASNKVMFWRYYAYGQVEYYAKIRWYVNPQRYKSYIPIGPGGMYQNWDEMEEADAKDPSNWSRYVQLIKRSNFRKGQNMLTNSTGTELDQSNQFIHM